MAKIQLGKFKANGQEYQKLQINRTLGPSMGDQAYLGRFSSHDGNHSLALSIHDVTADTIAQYKIFSSLNVANGVWSEVEPTSKLDKQDIVVSTRTDGPVISVRVTRITKALGSKEYQVKCLNLRPVMETYLREVEVGLDGEYGQGYITPRPMPQVVINQQPPMPPVSGMPAVPPMPMPPVPPVPPVIPPQGFDIAALTKMIMDHIAAPAPHTSHEIIARKNRPNGYVGLDESGLMPAHSIPSKGKLTIRIGDTVVVYDGSSDVDLSFMDSGLAAQLGVSVASHLNPESAATDDDIAGLFDDDPMTPPKADDDPGLSTGYIDDNGGSSSGSSGNNSGSHCGCCQPQNGEQQSSGNQQSGSQQSGSQGCSENCHCSGGTDQPCQCGPGCCGGNNEPVKYTVTLTVNNIMAGSVRGKGKYPQGSEIEIGADASSGFHFVQWSDGDRRATRTITVNSDIVLQAVFEANPVYFNVTTASNDLSLGTTSGSGNYAVGTDVTLTATSLAGASFMKWSDNGTNPEKTFIMPAHNISLTAYFGYSVTIASNDSNYGTVVYPSSALPGSPITLTPVPAEGYRFAGWSDGNNANPRTMTVDGPIDLQATFEPIPPSYTIDLSSNDDTMGSVSGGGTFEEGTDIEISATSAAGYRFVQWSDGNTQAIDRPIHVTSDMSIQAIFEAIPVIYNITISDTVEHGSIAGAGSYVAGSIVNLTPQADEGYHFVSWSDGTTDIPKQIIIDSDIIIGAVFAEDEIVYYNVNVSVNDSALGSVSGIPEGNRCAAGDQITLVASASSGSHFVEWSDGTNQAKYTITVDNDLSLQAIFERDIVYYTVTATSNNDEWGTVSGSNRYAENTQVTLTVEPSDGYRFVQWSDGDANPEKTFLATGDVTIQAIFERIVVNHTLTLSVNDQDAGSISGAESGEYEEGTKFTLTASSSPGYHFVEWSDGTSSPVYENFTLNDDTVLQAIFEKDIVYYNLNLSSNNTEWGTVPESGRYEENSEFNITATPSSTCHFVKWDDDVEDATRPIKMDKDITLQAIFAKNQRNVVLTSAQPDWGSVSGGGLCDEGTTITIHASPASGYKFVEWSDGDTNKDKDVTVGNTDITLQAIFEPIYYNIDTSSNDDTLGDVTEDPEGGTHLSGETVWVTATPKTNCRFVEWSDGTRDNPKEVKMTHDVTLQAIFEEIIYTITVVASSHGNVIGTGNYHPGDTATITANPDEFYEFDRWNDNNEDSSRDITVTGDATYTAYFKPIQYTLTVLSSDETMGTVTGSGTVSANTDRDISASPKTGYRFVQWNDGNTDNPRRVRVLKDETYTAEFAKKSYELTVNSNDTTMGTVSGSGTYVWGTKVDISADANNGYQLLSWNDGDTSTLRQITMPMADTTYTATFEERRYTLSITSNNTDYGTVSPSGGEYHLGDVVSNIRPSAVSGHRFIQWSDGTSDVPKTVTITGDMELQAIFTKVHKMTLAVEPSNYGNVSAHNRSYNEARFSGNVAAGEIVEVLTSSSAGRTFTGWSNGSMDNPVTITMPDNDLTFTAYYGNMLTVLSNDETMGTVTGSGVISPSESRIITANPLPGYRFYKWNDNNRESSRTVTVSSATATYTATFKQAVQVDVELPERTSAEFIGVTEPTDIVQCNQAGHALLSANETYYLVIHNDSDDLYNTYCEELEFGENNVSLDRSSVAILTEPVGFNVLSENDGVSAVGYARSGGGQVNVSQMFSDHAPSSPQLIIDPFDIHTSRKLKIKSYDFISNAGNANEYTVYGSNDGENWTMIADASNQTRKSLAASDKTNFYYYVSGTSASKHAVMRVTINSDYSGYKYHRFDITGSSINNIFGFWLVEAYWVD